MSNVGGGTGGWTDDHENKLRSPGAVRAQERLGSELKFKFDVAQTWFFSISRLYFLVSGSIVVQASSSARPDMSAVPGILNSLGRGSPSS